MNQSLNLKKLRLRIKKLQAAEQSPHVSHQPWAGFTRHDCPRENPLPVCPSPRCRRAKACIASHDTLYCQRTHFSPAEQKKRQRHDPHQRAMDSVPAVAEPCPISARLKRLVELAAIRLEQADEMTARWKAGEFDQLYGPYTPKGVLMKAPPKVYLEWPAKGGTRAFKGHMCSKSRPDFRRGDEILGASAV